MVPNSKILLAVQDGLLGPVVDLRGGNAPQFFEFVEGFQIFSLVV